MCRNNSAKVFVVSQSICGITWQYHDNTVYGTNFFKLSKYLLSRASYCLVALYDAPSSCNTQERYFEHIELIYKTSQPNYNKVQKELSGNL